MPRKMLQGSHHHLFQKGKGGGIPRNIAKKGGSCLHQKGGKGGFTRKGGKGNVKLSNGKALAITLKKGLIKRSRRGGGQWDNKKKRLLRGEECPAP